MRTLQEELRHVWETDWRHRASGKCLLSQAEIAVTQILWPFSIEARRHVTAVDIDAFRITEATKEWYSGGLSPATITKRLNCLSRLGVNVTGCRPKKGKGALKWWLTPALQVKLQEGLGHGLDRANALSPSQARLMSAYVHWTIHTGLRVEESLRLTWSMVHGLGTAEPSVTVPGTKTDGAQATLPLSAAACTALVTMRDHASGVEQRVFPVEYDRLEALWSKCRAYIGHSQTPTATLKALRRNAARHLHIDLGMPLDMVRDYLRHDDIETTQGYLKLVGGYQAEEMRRWVK